VVLVDTSVWIRFLVGTEPYATELDRLLSLEAVLGHDFVYGELLVGDRGGRARVLSAYTQLRQARTIVHAEVAEFVRRRKINGRGIGWIDVHLLASALVEHASLWTADRSLVGVAHEIGVAYEPARQ